MNTLKVIIYKLYFLYYSKFPFNKGKDFFLRRIYNILGNATFNIRSNYFNLSPISLIDKKLILTGSYEPDLVEVIYEHIGNEDIFVDIGANIGYYSIIASKIKGSHVISFEPSSREGRKFQNNLSLNGITNVTFFSVALSNDNENRNLHIFDISNPGENTFLSHTTSAGTEPIRCYKFSNLITPFIAQKTRLIKIDVEGFEYEVLKGMETIMPFYAGSFIIEICYPFSQSDSINPDLIYDWMANFGYAPLHGKRFQNRYNEIFSKQK